MTKLIFENLNTFYPDDTYGEFNIPKIRGVDKDITELIGFNDAKSAKHQTNGAVHFFLDDYQFNILWTKPDIYIDRLRQFDAVLTPDFSLYTDMPVALQIYNHYRKHWLGAYWEYLGLDVIPTIAWSDENSFTFCFDGEPTKKTVAISAIGTQKNKETKKLFLNGFEKMVEVLNPTNIICYGIPPEKIKNDVIEFKSFAERRF